MNDFLFFCGLAVCILAIGGCSLLKEKADAIKRESIYQTTINTNSMR